MTAFPPSHSCGFIGETRMRCVFCCTTSAPFGVRPSFNVCRFVRGWTRPEIIAEATLHKGGYLKSQSSILFREFFNSLTTRKISSINPLPPPPACDSQGRPCCPIWGGPVPLALWAFRAAALQLLLRLTTSARQQSSLITSILVHMSPGRSLDPNAGHPKPIPSDVLTKPVIHRGSPIQVYQSHHKLTHPISSAISPRPSLHLNLLNASGYSTRAVQPPFKQSGSIDCAAVQLLLDTHHNGECVRVKYGLHPDRNCWIWERPGPARLSVVGVSAHLSLSNAESQQSLPSSHRLDLTSAGSPFHEIVHCMNTWDTSWTNLSRFNFPRNSLELFESLTGQCTP
ncbi:hypothetical protein B0H13DRAFT_1873166 [Mycena leptocephala]|nr:hypothetical protein B0H13DRAFT_1873166 [Mycena leptocephala]